MSTKRKPQIAIIGGTTLIKMPKMTNVEVVTNIDTPFGKCSSPITIGTIEGKDVAFLFRHGEKHELYPHEVNYAANIFKLKKLGVKFIIGVSAGGILQEEIKPGDSVIPDQIVDFTKGKRKCYLFGNGIVLHPSIADPFCEDLRKILITATKATKAHKNTTIHTSGTFVTIEGYHFGTRAESYMWRLLNFKMVGMTTASEAKSARDAELSYAVYADPTDYDSWKEGEEVSNEDVTNRAKENSRHINKILVAAISMIDVDADYPTHHSLAKAFAMKKGDIPPIVIQKLFPVIGKYFPDRKL